MSQSFFDSYGFISIDDNPMHPWTPQYVLSDLADVVVTELNASHVITRLLLQTCLWPQFSFLRRTCTAAVCACHDSCTVQISLKRYIQDVYSSSVQFDRFTYMFLLVMTA